MKKYKIEKRLAGENGTWDIDRWPWRLVYPNGDICLCFTHGGAVSGMNDALNSLKSQHSHFNWLARKYWPQAVESI